MRTKLIIIAILLAAAAVRLIGLGVRPAGLTWDEAALGYNAYSLLLTGRDEHGLPLPVIFKSFGDYKPGLYIYLTVLPTATLGLQEFSTRLPSAVSGILLCAAIYLLTRYLFPDQPEAAVFSLLVSAVNPWLIHFSRGAWEANLNLFLTVMAVVWFVRHIRRPHRLALVWSGLFFGLTFWTYQSAKLFTPLLLLALFAVYRRSLSWSKAVGGLLLVTGLLLLPVISGVAAQSGRLKVFSLFSYTRNPEDVQRLLREDQTQDKNLIYFLYHTELLDQLRGVARRYLNHFSPQFLFGDGDWTNLRHSEYRQGYFYLSETIAVIIGLICLVRFGSRRPVRLLWLWACLSVLPSALSRDLVSGVRSLPLAVPLIMIIAFGLARIWQSRFRLPYLAAGLFFLFYYLEFYFLHSPYYAAPEYVSAYRQAVAEVAGIKPEPPRVYFTDQLGQPYIFLLYYLKYDPARFHLEAVREESQTGDVGKVLSFGKFYFQPVFWPKLRGETGAVFVGGQYELPSADLASAGAVTVADIHYPNGSHALRVAALP